MLQVELGAPRAGAHFTCRVPEVHLGLRALELPCELNRIHQQVNRKLTLITN